jgi:hypothetical protein
MKVMQRSTEAISLTGESDVMSDSMQDRSIVSVRLPDGALGASHLRDVFGRMGYSDQVRVSETLCGTRPNADGGFLM